MKRGIPVLMYHALESPEHPAGYNEPGDQIYVLSVEQFREQMRSLSEGGFQTFFLDEILNLAELPEKAVVLTFDDGHVSNFTLALPILQEFGFKAEFFITTGWIGTPHFMTPAQIVQLYDEGMQIGTHGVSHAYLSDLDDCQVFYELTDSKQALEQILGQEVDSIAFPGGRHPKNSTLVSATGYRLSYSSQVGLFAGRELIAIPRVAMRSRTSIQDFAKVVQGNRAYYSKAETRAGLLSLSKKLLGNRRYETLRSLLVK